VAYYADAGHPEIHDDEVAWCAAFVGAMLKRAGYPGSGSLAARSYLNYGRKIDKPEPGCIVVFWRGSPTSWEGHVAFYVRDDGSHIRVLGGNQGNAVTEASYPRKQVLGYRMPVPATVKALREAGSSEVKTADTVQKVAVGTAVATAAAEVAAPAAPPIVAPSIVPKVDPALLNAVEQLSATQKLMEGTRAVANLMVSSRGIMVIGLCLAAFGVAWWWKRRRANKHAAGAPIGVGG
jgi:uncharacterized protein (TIGR02594 family)